MAFVIVWNWSPTSFIETRKCKALRTMKFPHEAESRAAGRGKGERRPD